MVAPKSPVAVDTAELRKARGAFFTPLELCGFVAEWAVRSASDRVLEPSCGEAAFLLAAGSQLQELGAKEAGKQLFGVELHEASAASAKALLLSEGLDVEVGVGDFFETEVPGPFDAVVGNPPYVRYQDFTGTARAKSQEAALAQGVRLTGLASSWASFVVHAGQYLKPDGRLGLVLPAELLTVNYAANVREHLLSRFAAVRLVLFEGRVFPGVTEEVVLLLAEGTGPTDHFELYLADDLDDLPKPESVATKWKPKYKHGKWSGALLSTEAAEVYADVTSEAHFEELSDWGDPNLGMVTGNNNYFALTYDDVGEWGLEPSDLLPISPPGSRHLRSLSFTSQRWRALADAGARAFLFYPRGDELSKGASAYIAYGKKKGVHKAYKCRVRDPWWRVPLVPVPDLFLTYMNNDAPRLVANRIRARYLNSVHGVELNPGRREVGKGLLPLAMLNSATLLGAELVGRSYGGGILKLEPKEADVLPVPSLSAITDAAAALRKLRPTASALLAQGRLPDVVALVDEVMLSGTAGRTAPEVELLDQSRLAMFARRTARKG